ncbi:glycosyltransferase [Candidatus Latescibacterota bacterium]
MINTFPELIIILYAGLYFLVSVVVLAGVKRVKSYGLPAELPDVSVIVCARDEEEDIGRCLDSLLDIDYPREKLEIILVDDESGDRTGDILREYASGSDLFRVLSTENELHDLPGKQRPLNLGIRKAQGSIILVTDADIEVQPGWIKGHLAAYTENTGIVGGITRVSTGQGGILAKLQNADQVSKLTIAMGCAGLGIPLTIMGNNCSFRRDAYFACGGFWQISASIVEDVELMYYMTRNTQYSLNWTSADESMACSIPEESLSSFIEQRYRMMSIMKKAPLFGKMLIFMEMIMVLVFVSSIAASMNNFWPLIITGTAWLAANSIILMSSPGKKAGDILYVPGMLIFQVIYGIGLAWRSIFGRKKIAWKHRSYDTR